MNNSINFKGAFLLHHPSTTVKKNILPALGKHRQVFNNFTPEGDVLYITRKGADKNVAEFLTNLIETQKTKKKAAQKFKYYPELSTKSGFDDGEPEEAKRILNEYKDTIITTISELSKVFKLNLLILNISLSSATVVIILSL